MIDIHGYFLDEDLQQLAKEGGRITGWYTYKGRRADGKFELQALSDDRATLKHRLLKLGAKHVEITAAYHKNDPYLYFTIEVNH